MTRRRDLLPLLVLATGAIAATAWLPPWLSFWTIAASIFHGAKWIAWSAARRAGLVRSLARTVGWFLLWAGMDARAFFDASRRPAPPTRTEWATATGWLVLGAALVWGGARLAPADAPLLAGWIGLFGIAFLLLFGTFRLVSCAWRRAGVDAAPLWLAPARATSLPEFWGVRWNRAFSDLARAVLVRPLRRTTGRAGALVGVFLVSGLAHDAILSVPARAGYGLPTAYFLLQAVGVAWSRSRRGRRLGVDRGRLGWLVTLAFVLPPSFALFHPWAVERVFVPMLRAAGAL